MGHLTIAAIILGVVAWLAIVVRCWTPIEPKAKKVECRGYAAICDCEACRDFMNMGPRLPPSPREPLHTEGPHR